jgi:DNA-binding response OmpR family regulator
MEVRTLIHARPRPMALARLADPDRDQLQRRHVFCVNGSSAFLDFIRALLQEEQYNVTTTNFTNSTFEQLRAAAPDLLIVDLEVGPSAGWDLIERVQANEATAELPIIVVSTNPGLLERARSAGTGRIDRAYIAKPFNIDDLLDAIAGLIGMA